MSTIGQPVPQVNALQKVTGRSLYGADLYMPGMLHVKVVRSPHPHARIIGIDASAARALSGVHAVFTAEDTPDLLSGFFKKEHRILAAGKVRFVGEEVVAVVAETEHRALDAIELIDVEYQVLPVIENTDAALTEGAIEVHAGSGNVAWQYDLHHGDVDAAFQSCDIVHEEVYSVHSQYPGYLEPMATVAWIADDGRLTIWLPSQTPSLAQSRVAEALCLPTSKIRVIQATTGGGFGAKAVEECNSLICAFVAFKTGRPVRFVNSRLDDFQGARSSIPERIWLKMGATRDGRVIAKDARIVAECGAYTGLGPPILQVSTIRGDNIFRHLRNVRCHSKLVYTNAPPRGAFRGFGNQQTGFAVNSHFSVLAEKLGIDPVEMWRRNTPEAGDVSVYGFEIGSCGLSECLNEASSAIDWNAKVRRPIESGRYRRGVGVGTAIHVSGNRMLGDWDGSTIVLKMGTDGRITLLTGEADAGQGSITSLAQLCAHELCLPLDHVTVLAVDTDRSPFGIGAISSRVTINAGNAVLKASRELKQLLLAHASAKLGIPPEALVINNATIAHHQPGANCMLRFADIARAHIFMREGEEISVRATYDPPTVMADRVSQFGNVAAAYSFAAQTIEVEIDTETGNVEVIDTCVADDCGIALNPLSVHGQTYGAVVQAIGWTLYEELRFDGCRLQNGNLADYTMPTAGSVPPIKSILVETNDPLGPLGAKGASETAIVPGAGAIANAIYDAIGVRFNELPITPEKILAALADQAHA